MTTLPSRLPLIQAPMVGSLSPLAIAVCEAGGLGSLVCAAGLRDAFPRAVGATGQGAPAREHRRIIWVFVSPIQAPPP